MGSLVHTEHWTTLEVVHPLSVDSSDPEIILLVADVS